MTQVLTRKIQIIKPVSTDWKTFDKIAGNVFYHATRIMNDAISMQYEHEQEKRRYREQVGKAMSVKEVYGVTYTTIINRELKERYAETGVDGDRLEQIARQALDTWKIHKSEVMKGNASLPTFRRDQPVTVRASGLKLSEDNTVMLNLMNGETAVGYGFKGKNKQSIEVQLKEDRNNKVILERVKSGEYKLADSKIQRTLGGKYFLLMSYHQPIKEVEQDPNVVMGIDMGVSKALVMAISDSKKVYEINGGEIESFRRRTEARRKSLRNQLRVASQNRRGHGKKTLLKPLEKLSSKVDDFKSLTNHRYSKYVIDKAIKHGVGKIQLEDLTGISSDNSFLKTWSYFDLQTKIEYKAKSVGIEIVKVNPKYTSQRCFNCGVIDKENRQTQATFNCTTCGHKRNADYNAAENLTLDGISDIINLQLEIQK